MYIGKKVKVDCEGTDITVIRREFEVCSNF